MAPGAEGAEKPRVVVEPVGTWRYRCEGCGWRSSVFFDRDDAEFAGGRHRCRE